MKLHNLTGRAGGVHVDRPSVILHVTSDQPVIQEGNPLVIAVIIFAFIMSCIVIGSIIAGGLLWQ